VFPTRLHRRLTAWMALVAMLAFALLPTLSRAMAFAGGGTAWAEVCTPQGLKRVSLSDAGTDTGTPGPNASHLEACAFCSLATDGAAPLPSSPVGAALPLGRTPTPRLFLQAAATLHAWRSAQPRAPPSGA
jgi:Protein of unknown function (DUF2946)